MNVAPLLRWMHERHAIYERRSRGDRAPWTTDPILAKYRFTNVFRELDRVTVWMRDNVTHPLDNAPHNRIGLLAFNCVYFRWFGRPEPFGKFLPHILYGWAPETRCRVNGGVDMAQHFETPVYTNAYTIHGENGVPRIGFVLKVLDHVWANLDAITSTARLNSLEATFNEFRRLPGFGGNGFMAYEIVTDLRHTKFFDCTPTDIMTWTNTGPGSMRGMNRLLPCELKTKWKRDEFCVVAQKVLLEINRGWNGPQLELRDIEHSLCEFDKYERIRLGQGRGRPYKGAA